MSQNNQIFCDWLTVKQTHINPHNPVHGNFGEYTDIKTGETHTVYQFRTIEGKHKSSFQIRSDGYTVEYSGNPSRFNQENNVQGINLDECKLKINALLTDLGLPPFTIGETIRNQTQEKGIDLVYTGAKITRIDMTQNFKTGSARRRDIYMQWIQSQNYGKLAKKCYQNLNTTFGEETETRSFKIYNKALELESKKKKQPIAKVLHLAGAIRFEMCYRKILKTRYTNTWEKANQLNMAQQFSEDIKPMRKKIETIDLSELPPNLVGTYLMYERGIVRKLLSPSTFKRHKKQLLPYGVDISNTVNKFTPKKEVIELEEFDQDELLQG